MVTATIIDLTKVESQRHHRLAAPPSALRMTAQMSLHRASADMAWLPVSEPRAQTAVIRDSHGARSAAGLGLTIEPGAVVGGAILLTLAPWRGEVSGDGRKICAERVGVGKGARMEFELPVEP